MSRVTRRHRSFARTHLPNAYYSRHPYQFHLVQEYPTQSEPLALELPRSTPRGFELVEVDRVIRREFRLPLVPLAADYQRPLTAGLLLCHPPLLELNGLNRQLHWRIYSNGVVHWQELHVFLQGAAFPATEQSLELVTRIWALPREWWTLYYAKVQRDFEARYRR